MCLIENCCLLQQFTHKDSYKNLHTKLHSFVNPADDGSWPAYTCMYVYQLSRNGS